MAEERGFRAVVEEPVLDAGGRVDVALSRGDLRVACEVSVTTDAEQERANVEKCLAAGFDQVFLISPNRKRLGTLTREVAGRLPEAQQGRVHVVSPEEFMAGLETLGAPQDTAQQTIRGYRVTVTQRAAAGPAAATRRATYSCTRLRLSAQREAPSLSGPTGRP
ncbi:MAG: hypothetical protein HY521_01095 [Proteobacteria bacterium]|nr:hypothetical protein [Pseudomonadota bacterium]